MRQSQWQLQTAKAKLSELVEAALRGEPQRITRRGKDAVMVVSEKSFIALKQSARADAANLVSHLLAMPREKATKVPKEQQMASKLGVAASRLRLRDLAL